MSKPFVLQVRLAAHPGQAEALERLLSEAAVHLATNQACWVFIVGRSPTEGDVLLLSEAWISREAHDAALHEPRAQAFIQRALPLLAEPPATVELGPVGVEELRECAAPW
jgi:quinol monooxygenase YgiN